MQYASSRDVILCAPSGGEYLNYEGGYQLRRMLPTHEDLRRKIEAMERKYDQQFKVVFDAIKQLLEKETKPKRKMWF